MTTPYDAIVIGLGGMGSAALCHLAKRGLRVLGIEQFEIAHDRGSSHGETRIIRRAYFEHPDYVPLVDASYTGWSTLARESAIPLFVRAGLLLAGLPKGQVIAGTRQAAAAHDLAIETLTHKDCEKRFPGIRLDKKMDILFEPDAGFLRVEDCVKAHVERAQAAGAESLTNARVLNWSASPAMCTVEAETMIQPQVKRGGLVPAKTSATAVSAVPPVDTPAPEYRRRTLEAKRLIICGGPWAAQLLADLKLPLTVRRKVALWFAIDDTNLRLDRGFPAFGVDWNEHFFYGFPSLDGAMMKVADHTGGETAADPSNVDRELTPDDSADVKKFVAKHLPGITGDIARHSVCMYTMTPDEHFIVDRHPQQANVCFAAGFSGHGFKFAPVIGATLADLAMDRPTPSAMDFLKLRRFPSTLV